MKVDGVFALHGNLGSADDWTSLGIPNVRAVDLWDLVDLSFDELADHLADELAVGMERPVIAGYSLGGRLALHAMVRYPDRWAGAIILAAHPGLVSEKERANRCEGDDLWARRVREDEWDDFLADWNALPVFSASSPSEVQRGLEARRFQIATAFERWSLGRQVDLRSPLARFSAPVLWITGERDEKFNSLAEEMAGVFPQFESMQLPGKGHRVLSPEIAPILSAFIDGL